MPVPSAAGERPSIAVLPFDNLSSDADQAYFSDGIAEDLLTALSRLRDLRVLARHSSFAFRGQSLDAVELGRRLGVGYLLEGSVRRMGARVRITAQLIDASAGDHVWAERYDRPLDDIFAIQDELVATIAATLAGRIWAAGVDRAKRKPTSDLAAYDLVLRGTERLASYDEGANEAAVALFDQQNERVGVLIGSIPGIVVGSRLASRVHERFLRLFLAVILIAVAFKLLST